jgi:hypothetical protein
MLNKTDYATVGEVQIVANWYWTFTQKSN